MTYNENVFEENEEINVAKPINEEEFLELLKKIYEQVVGMEETVRGMQND